MDDNAKETTQSEAREVLETPRVEPDAGVDTNQIAEARTEPAEPSLRNGSGNGRNQKVCKSCEASNPSEAGSCVKCGRFLAANRVALRAGIYARYKPADLVMTADQLEAGIVSDLGGVDGMSTLERSYVRKMRDLEITLRLLASDIARNSLLTPGGRVRDVYSAFLAGLDRFDRYAQRVGLERRQRPVSSPLDYIRGEADL